MPLPLSLAFFGMHFARRLHRAPSFDRPRLLSKVYYARFALYCAFAGMATATYLTTRRPSDDEAFRIPLLLSSTR